MDYILKLLEEEEEVAIHSGVDVDAAAAELSRHMEGTLSPSQPLCSNTVMSQGMDHGRFYHQWQSLSHNENVTQQSQLDRSIVTRKVCVFSEPKQPSPVFDIQPHNIYVSRSQAFSQTLLQQKQDVVEQSFFQPSTSSQLEIYENNAQYVPQSGLTPISEQEAQLSELQQTDQQATIFEKGKNGVTNGKRYIPMDLLVQLLSPQLDKERSAELTTMYLKLKKKEIPKDGLGQQLIRIAGKELYMAACRKLTAQVGERNSQEAANRSQGAALAQTLSMQSASAARYRQPTVQACQQVQNTSVDPSQKIRSAVQLSGNNVSVRKPITYQEKLFETSTPPSSRGSLDQGIEQLNDVTAISGINLRQEEEQLFSGSTRDSQVLEASRRVALEEEETLILRRAPLKKKLDGIMLKYGVTSISNNVEKCLSMCLEERISQLIRNLIRQSKQRTDVKKPKDRSCITSDIRQQILLLNQKCMAELGKKQAEIERLQKIESNPASDCVEEKEEGCGQANKANKEENKEKTTAANAAARAALGGNYLQSKWQLMTEKAPQKHGGSSAAASSSQPSPSGRNLNRYMEKMCSSAAGVAPGFASKVGNAQADVSATPTLVERTISVKDVIAVLGREPQMSKSTLLHSLYNKEYNTDNSSKQREAD